MSTVLKEKNSVKARKAKWCCLCGERIKVGELKDIRTGVDCGDFWVMNMHPECHLYERKPGVVDIEWYEDAMEPAFDRAEAIVFCKSNDGEFNL